MQGRDGEALSRRERGLLAEIEQGLGQDAELELALRTMRRRRFRWLHRRSSTEGVGAPGGGMAAPPAVDPGHAKDPDGHRKNRKQPRD